MLKDGRRVELRFYNDGTKPERPVRICVKGSDSNDSEEKNFVFDSMAHAYIYFKRTHQRELLDHLVQQALANQSLRREQWQH